MPAHPQRTFQLERIVELELEGWHADPDRRKRYSPELFIRQRILEFPFERYPDYCYPGHLLQWPKQRWDQVDQVVRFIEGLKQPTGTGKGRPVRLLGFQVLILACILGPEGDDGLRLSRTIVMSIARKNAKTALVAMMFLAMLSLQVFNLRIEEVRIGAADREQAGKLFEMLRNMILLDDRYGLVDLYQITPSKKLITHKKTLSTIKVISSDAHRAHGSNDFGVLLDELGNLPDPAARQFYSVLSTGFGTQAEPLLLMFSTQAATDSHLFSEFVDQVKGVNTQQDHNSRVTGFIFDLPKEDDETGLKLLDDGRTVDHFAEQNWTRPNPALEGLVEGGFRKIKDLRDKAREAKDMPSLENTFRNLQLNQRITSHSPFLSQQAWLRCQASPIDPEFLLAAPCYLGGDLSVTTDLSSLAFVWRLDSGKYYARLLAYTPQTHLAERAKVSKVPYDLWVREGHLRTTPGAAIDYAVIAHDLVDMAEQHAIEQAGFDRYKWRDVRKECSAAGFDPYEDEEGDFWVPIGQGFLGMNPCVEALEKLVLTERLMIEQNPVATWCAANTVTVADDAGNRKFSKAKSYGRIDTTVALAMAVWLASQGDLDDRAGADGRSAYEDTELLVL